MTFSIRLPNPSRTELKPRRLPRQTKLHEYCEYIDHSNGIFDELADIADPTTVVLRGHPIGIHPRCWTSERFVKVAINEKADD